jgi:PAS domain S-box-containing protein
MRSRNVPAALRLLILLIAVVAPLIGFSGLVLLGLARAERAAVEQRVLDEARALGFTVERELVSIRRAATLLATAPQLQESDFAAFHRRARAALGSGVREVSLSELSGRQVLHTGHAYGEPLPPDPDALRIVEAMDGQEVRISRVKPDADGTPTVAVQVAVRSDDGVLRLLSVVVDAGLFQQLVGRREMPRGWTAGVVDREGAFVACVPHPERCVGKPAASDVIARASGQEGSLESVSAEEAPVFTAYARIPIASWLLTVSVPEDVLARPLRRSLLLILLGGMAALALSILAAFWGGRQLTRPLAALARAAAALGRREAPPAPPRGLREAYAVGEALERAFAVISREEQERRETGRRLTESEQERQEALRAAGAGTWSGNLLTGERSLGPSCRALLGLGMDEPVDARRLVELVHPDDRERVADVGNLFVPEDSDRLAFDFRVLWPDGSVHWLRAQGAVVSRDAQGRAVDVKGILVGIDELRRREQELRASEDRYRAIVENAIDAIIVGDENGVIQSFNQVAERMFQHRAEEAIGRNVKLLMPAETAREHDRSMARYLETGEARIIGRGTEVEAQRKDGTTFPAELTLADWRAGGKLYFTAIIRDITTRRQDEEARLRLEAQLHQAQKMEALGQLTGGIAHDFNNLLLAINLNLETLEEDFGSDPSVKPLIEGSRHATGHAQTLIAQLLAFARRQALHPAPFAVNAAVRELTKILRRTLEASIGIETVLAEDVWTVFADRHQLEAALLNLAINARDAMPNGGTIVIETRNATLDAAFVERHPDASPGDYVTIAMSDTGTGMSADVVARAFDPFFTTKGQGKGTGLGLSQVYGYVKQSGGYARIESEPGAGTRVELFLPRSHELPAMPVTAGGGEPAGRGETILMVEDSQLVRHAVRRMLSSLGYAVIEAATATEAIELLNGAQRIDLLFTDMVLPGGLGGAELAETARGLRPDIRVLYTSGYTQMQTLLAGNEEGIALLPKPYTKAELARRLRETLG